MVTLGYWIKLARVIGDRKKADTVLIKRRNYANSGEHTVFAEDGYRAYSPFNTAIIWLYMTVFSNQFSRLNLIHWIGIITETMIIINFQTDGILKLPLNSLIGAHLDDLDFHPLTLNM